MNKLHKLLILDDDPHYSGMLALKLKSRFPELMVSSSEQKSILHGYDIYILDNDFGGEKCGAKLAEEVRTTSPNSLVVILSGTLEFNLLKRLVNCHAAGVFDKSQISEVDTLMCLIENYIQTPVVTVQGEKPSLIETLGSISGLLSQWNKKMAMEERR
tara:strand:- start:1520 stop:1993 length:474 start_codon:yes stop_codon:yes gene_type:complete